jgi:hypothetical protein
VMIASASACFGVLRRASACLGAVPVCLVKPRFAMFRASQMFAPSGLFEPKV